MLGGTAGLPDALVGLAPDVRGTPCLRLDERLSVRGWVGCAAILAGMLIAELRAGAPPPAPPEDQTATAAGPPEPAHP